jgi:signal transduction histidine kinase
MRARRIDRINLLIYGGTIVFLAGAIAILFWLRRQYEQDIESSIHYVKGLFGEETVLKGRGDINVRFSQIESLAGAARTVHIMRIYVSKVMADGREHLLYPFYYAAVHPHWRGELEQLRKEPLVSQGETYGYIYFDLDTRIINSVKMATIGFGALLVITTSLLVSRLRVQERVLTRTTVELEQKRREMIRLERLARAGQLSANIFHDVKKPVLNIKHDLETMLESAGAQPLQPTLEAMRHQVDLFFSMLRDLNLERFVKAHDTEKEYVDVNEIIERSLQLVKYESGDARVERHYAAGLPSVLAFPHRLIQVFSNIILNAFQAMNGKGELEIRTAREDAHIVVTIRDTGPGISAGHLEEIFRPFFTTKGQDEGAGLGLYISREIIREMRGDIAVESGAGRGTTFRIIIPVSEKKSGVSTERTSPDREGTRNGG